MNYSIIPEYSEMTETLALTNEYNVNLEYNDFCNPSVYEDDAEIGKRIERYLSLKRDRSKDTMHGAFLALDIAAKDSVIRNRTIELYDKSLMIANRLGIKGVVFHTGLIGTLRLKYYTDSWLEAAEKFWKDRCKKYPKLIVFIENSFEQSPDIFEELMERMVDVPNFKICLDYGHAMITATPIEEWVKKLAPYIGHMHLNDNDLINDLHLVPGTGKIDFDKWYRLMKENEIDTSVLLEINGLENAKAALDFVRGKYE